MRVELPYGVVDVWQLDLDAEAHDLHLLSAEEEARAERFRRPQDGRRWRRSRAALRSVLAGYVGADPRALALGTAAHGKPFLAEPASDVRFNLSHAGAAALVAFARGVEVGVDVELRARRVDPLAVARRALGEDDARALEALPLDRRQEGFLHAWVRHEATVKCVGTGLGASASNAAGVWVTGLEVGPEWVAAVAASQGPCQVRLRRLPAASSRTREPLEAPSHNR